MNWPLMYGNICNSDLEQVRLLFDENDPKLTQGPRVKQFEKDWSNWLGVKYSIFVNSGSSANLITLSALNILYPKGGEVIVPALTWSSDVVSVIKSGFTPKFVDINLNTLGLDENKVIENINEKTVAVFITHCQGYNALSDKLINYLKNNKIHLIEDVCESHGAKHKNIKLGNFGLMSNFSFYYAHHMTTIEGGMICTNDEEIADLIRCLRGHGLLREMSNKKRKDLLISKYKNLNPEFIFLHAGFNMRNDEISAIIGINQLKRLDSNILKRNLNYYYFFDKMKNKNIFKDFVNDGISNYAINIIAKYPDKKFFNKITNLLTELKIEYRIGSAGGGNQLRQPYLRNKNFNIDADLTFTDHVHFYGLYIGNFPELKREDIDNLVEKINEL